MARARGIINGTSNVSGDGYRYWFVLRYIQRNKDIECMLNVYYSYATFIKARFLTFCC